MRLSAGRVEDIPEDRCIAAGEGLAIVVRLGDHVVAYENRCLHQESPLAGGIVREGVLTCPMHFWRYRIDDGTHVGTSANLARYPVEIIDGVVWVDVPDPEPPRSMRERLLAHAEEWRNEHP